MRLKKLSILIALIVCSSLVFSSCGSKYCEGGKKKYKRMKKDTNMMVF
jgi:hypothetical protein